MKGYKTSYNGIFGREFQPGHRVDTIEIPLIQRDYAQGRSDVRVKEIRQNFLTVLLEAVAGGEPVDLDFVYGNVESGTFYPLDGQQRLTTLFLLHWYLASGAGVLDADAPWTRFSYATRPGARLFCQRLAAEPLAADVSKPSAWITDQPWYLYLWFADPTIQSMLVMIDAIHDEIRGKYPHLDATASWQRLTDATSPAISFYLLPLDDMDSAEELYIKMNSRGKPLTVFENFKALFERDISYSPRAHEFAHKIDGQWSDLLWPFDRDNDNGNDVVDDEFVRYFDYLIEICELREGRVPREYPEPNVIGQRARSIFGAHNPRAAEHLDFLFGAFDTWESAKCITGKFGELFTLSDGGLSDGGVSDDGAAEGSPGKVVLFDVDSVNLFERCLASFGNQSGKRREFTLPLSLLLYAVLIHQIASTEDSPRRLRILRNLVEASGNEIRRDAMPELLRSVDSLVSTGDLDSITGFSGNQIADEKRKHDARQLSVERATAIDLLEDHPFLRGTLSAFDVTAPDFDKQAAVFAEVFTHPETWRDVMGALLATGDYQRQPANSARWEFGSSVAKRQSSWRGLLTDATWERLTKTREVLGTFLTGFAESGRSVTEYAVGVMKTWLAMREEARRFDWRYLLVKYPLMRTGDSGYYFGVGSEHRDTQNDPELGYSMVMMLRLRVSSYHRDPILLQIYESIDIPDRIVDPWFYGSTSIPRWLRLTNSSAGLRSVAEGFHIDPPGNPELVDAFRDVLNTHGAVAAEIQASPETVAEGFLLRVPQSEHNGRMIDTVDRVQIGAAFVRDLIEHGL